MHQYQLIILQKGVRGNWEPPQNILAVSTRAKKKKERNCTVFFSIFQKKVREKTKQNATQTLIHIVEIPNISMTQ